MDFNYPHEKRRQSLLFQTDSINNFVAEPRHQLNKTTIYNRTYDKWHQIHSPQQQEKECGFRVCVMASIFATTHFNYQAGVDKLIGIKNLPQKCREHVMDVLQQQKWTPPTWI